jgi:integrase
MKLDKRLNGKRYQIESGCDGTDHEDVLRMWDDLAAAGRTDVLQLICEHRVCAADLLGQWRMGDLWAVTYEARLRQNLWRAVDTLLAPKKYLRYRQSFNALKKTGVLGEKVPISALASVDWVALEQRWPNPSAADWNHCRKAVSFVLTRILRNQHHPLRQEIMFGFPKRQEEARLPEIDPSKLHLVSDPRVRDVVLFLAVFGLRVSEYYGLRLEDWDGVVLTVNGTKNRTSRRRLRVPEELAGFVSRMIPAPIGYQGVSKHWRSERERIGLSGIRLHDLRHLCGQEAASVIDMRSVADLLGHSNIQQSYKYARRAVADAPMPAFMVLQAPTPEVPLVN